jgi:hypothetical protein
MLPQLPLQTQPLGIAAAELTTAADNKRAT